MSEIIKKVSQYYTQKIEKYGVSPQGVDWNSLESQQLRFEMLSKVVDCESRFSILDYGCGYGGLTKYFDEEGFDYDYFGFDVSKTMISKAQMQSKENQQFSTQLPDRTFDYVIASGIFSVKLNITDAEWSAYIIKTLREINQLSKKGFAFNMLTSYSDKELMRNDLHYADPLYYFDFCKNEFSKRVALLHDYPLYEFSIIVRK